MHETEAENRSPVLDGIRGIAVLLVLIIHFAPDVAMQWRAQEWIKKVFTTGGWVGVDLFFVLSGFLITGILLKAKGSPNYFKNFYMRRALRIFPVYYGALIVVFLILPALGLVGGPAFEPIRDTQFYHWLYLSNVGYWLIGPDAFASGSIELRHFWSLAVEEHFYFIWPTVIFLASLRTTRYICLALILSALAFRCLGVVTVGPESMIYYLTPCRWDSLAAGALIATLVREYGVAGLSRFLPYALIVLAIGLSFLAIFFFSMKGLWAGHWLIRTFGLSALAAVFAATILVLMLYQDGPLGRIVGTGFLRFFGKYSYGLYIIHGLMAPPLSIWFPAEAWMSNFPNSPIVGTLSITITKITICTALAILSWHLYEKQFLKLKRHFKYASLSYEGSAAAKRTETKLAPVAAAPQQ